MTRIYLDHAASTPVDPRVLRAMQPFFSKKFGNPGSLHSFGQEALAAVDLAREEIGKLLGAKFREIVFTSSATEANNLALRGAVAAFRRANKETQPKILVSAIEHESVLETARALAEEGAELVVLPVDREGIVPLGAIEAALDTRVAVISVMYANNEIGTVEPIAEIAKLVHSFHSKGRGSAFPLFHSDAAQALQFLPCRVQELGVDLMTFSSHKLYGPKGAGALYMHEASIRASGFAPLFAGGGQEFGVRAGTENVPAIAGFAKAVELVSAKQASANNNIEELRARLWAGIAQAVPQAELHGPEDPTRRLPNILNIYFPGRSAEDLLTKLDLSGIAASSGSACRSRALEASYVIEALGYSREHAKQCVRFSLGRGTTKREIDRVIRTMAKIL